VKLKMLVLGTALALVPLAAMAYESQPSNTVGFMRFTTTTVAAAKQKAQAETKATAETRDTSQQKDKATTK
jgi:hypothetical protein